MFYSLLCQWSKSRLRQVYWCCGNWFTPYFEPLMYQKLWEFHRINLCNFRQHMKHNFIMIIWWTKYSFLILRADEIWSISFWYNLPDLAAPYRTDNGPVYLYVRFCKMNFCKDLALRRHTCESFNSELLEWSSSMSSTLVHNWEISPFSWVI